MYIQFHTVNTSSIAIVSFHGFAQEMDHVRNSLNPFSVTLHWLYTSYPSFFEHISCNILLATTQYHRYPILIIQSTSFYSCF